MRVVPTLMAGVVYVCLAKAAQGQTGSPALELPRSITTGSERLHSLEAGITLTWTTGGVTKHSQGTLRLMRPGFADIHLDGDYPERALVLDGTHRYLLDDKAHYKESAATAGGADASEPWWGLPYRFFFTANTSPFGAVPDRTATLRSATQKNGELLITRTGTAPMAYSARLLFNAQGVLERSDVFFGDPDHGAAVFSAELHDIRLNRPMSPASFRFVPPAHAVLDTADASETLLAVGSRAKDFALPAPGGGLVRSSTARTAGKVLLVNFWYLNCPPCRLEFPDLEKLYTRLHREGLEMIAVNKGDAPAPVAAYVNKAGLTMPIVLGGPETRGSVFDSYNVQSFPVTYLLDAEGKVLFRTAQADIPAIQSKLAELGLK